MTDVIDNVLTLYPDSDYTCSCGGLQFRLGSDGMIRCAQCKGPLPGAVWGFVETDFYNRVLKRKPGEPG
jgi:hypothetical protein